MTRVSLTLALLLAGCASTPDTPVRPVGHGRGAVVGPRRVATVEHVANSYAEVGPLRRQAKVSRRYPLPGGHPRAHDGVVVLELAEGESEVGPVVSRWRTLVPGDSGSPLYDSEGRCVGLFRGWLTSERLVGEFLPAPEGGWK